MSVSVTYNGYLADYVPIIATMVADGATTGEIADRIIELGAKSPSISADYEEWSRQAISQMVGYIIKRIAPADFEAAHIFTRAWQNARREHAVLLRCEGMTLHQIGLRLGVDRERARQLILLGGRGLRRALRKTRWTILEEPTWQEWV